MGTCQSSENGPGKRGDENSAGTNNGVRINGRDGTRGNKSGVFDRVYSPSASAILNARVGYTRFRQTRDGMVEPDITPAGLGFAARSITPNSATTRGSTWPTTSARSPPARPADHLVDLSVIKNFAFTETGKLQLRVEALNAFNHWRFNGPDVNPRNATFGRVTNSSQVHLPREYQIGLKLLF